MNHWQGDKICLRAMEKSDADFFYETLFPHWRREKRFRFSMRLCRI